MRAGAGQRRQFLRDDLWGREAQSLTCGGNGYGTVFKRRWRRLHLHIEQDEASNSPAKGGSKNVGVKVKGSDCFMDGGEQ